MKQAKQWFKIGILAVFVLTLIGMNGQTLAAPKYPKRDIVVVIPFSPGGSTDLANRVMAKHLKKKWGVNVIVANKPGGNTIPANLEVYNSKPDGYTILADNQPASSMLLVVVKDLPIEVYKKTFIAMTGYSPMILIVPASSPYKSIDDLIKEGKRNPSNFTWSSLGGAGAQDFAIRQFLKVAGIDARKTKPVMSKGGAQAAALTAGGHVKLGAGTATSARAVIESGDTRPLLITSPKRHHLYPNVPTAIELGYPKISCVYWIGMSGPPNMPAYVVETWQKAFKELMKDKEYLDDMNKVGTTAQYQDDRAMVEFIKKESKEVAELWSIK